MNLILRSTLQFEQTRKEHSWSAYSPRGCPCGEPGAGGSQTPWTIEVPSLQWIAQPSGVQSPVPPGASGQVVPPHGPDEIDCAVIPTFEAGSRPEQTQIIARIEITIALRIIASSPARLHGSCPAPTRATGGAKRATDRSNAAAPRRSPGSLALTAWAPAGGTRPRAV